MDFATVQKSRTLLFLTLCLYAGFGLVYFTGMTAVSVFSSNSQSECQISAFPCPQSLSFTFLNHTRPDLNTLSHRFYREESQVRVGRSTPGCGLQRKPFLPESTSSTFNYPETPQSSLVQSQRRYGLALLLQSEGMRSELGLFKQHVVLWRCKSVCFFTKLHGACYILNTKGRDEWNMEVYEHGQTFSNQEGVNSPYWHRVPLKPSGHWHIRSSVFAHWPPLKHVLTPQTPVETTYHMPHIFVYGWSATLSLSSSTIINLVNTQLLHSDIKTMPLWYMQHVYVTPLLTVQTAHLFTLLSPARAALINCA